MPFTTYLIPEPDKKETVLSSKWLWIVTDHELLPAHEELLHKICEALKANFTKDVHFMICHPSEPVSISVLNTNHTSLILSFGVAPSSLGIWIDLQNHGIRFMESLSFIFSPGLDELIQSTSSKKQLWSSIQSYLQWKENHS